MNESARPSLATRFRAKLRGERDAEALEAMRGAGTVVYSELTEAEKTRAELLAADQDLWSAPPSLGGHFLATWNAFVLQTLADGLLDADYAADAGTVGYVPPVTFDQAWTWFSTAESWLGQARQARSNPDHDLRNQLHLPAGPPAWAEVEPCPPAHLHAMMAAVPAVRAHADLAVYDLERCSTDDRRRRGVNRLRQLGAEAGAAADYAIALRSSTPGQRLHERIEGHLKRALTIWFHIGQLAAMPGLIEGRRLMGGAQYQ